jgi:hypothetical protein
VFVAAPPLVRLLLACFMAVPFVAATALMLARPAGGGAADPAAGGLGARLTYIGTLGGRRAERRPRGFDARALARFAVAAAVLAAALAAVKAAPAAGYPGAIAVRWLAAGIALLALAEMLTAGLPLLGTAMGVTASPLFRSPHRSTTLADFWARRWNLPASELFRRYCFGPLSRRRGGGRGGGTALALAATFAVSALGHAALADIALGRWAAASCALFFLAQPLAIAAERRMSVRRWSAAAGWAWTMAVLAATSPLLVEPVLRIVEKSWGPDDDVLRPTAIAVTFALALCAAVAIASRARAPAHGHEYMPLPPDTSEKRPTSPASTPRHGRVRPASG